MAWLFKESTTKWLIKHPSSNQVSFMCCFSIGDKYPNLDLCSNPEESPSRRFCCIFSRPTQLYTFHQPCSALELLWGAFWVYICTFLKTFHWVLRHFQQLIGAFEFKMESLSIHLPTLLAAKSNGLNYLWVTSENCNDSGILPRDFRN